MRPLFTVHAGEYLTGEHIEQKFPDLRVWVPTRDRGIDLLVTHASKRRQVSLQVKYSKDFRITHAASQEKLRAFGWWTLQRGKIVQSPADYWVLVLYGLARSVDFIVIPPDRLLGRLKRLKGHQDRYQVYIWTTETNRAWETRGLGKEDHRAIASGSFRDPARDFTRFLDNWSCLERLSRG